MDFATGGGLIAGTAVVLTLILLGGDLRTFYDVHGIIVIFGGAAAATLVRFPLSAVAHGVPMGAKLAFMRRKVGARGLVEDLSRLADVARKKGLQALETETVADPFLAKGLRLLADGYERDVVRDSLERERDTFLHHLDEAQKVYRAVGDCAPAFGMVGTLIGMVQMFANMSDPSKLGPFMAVALLATLYGALVGNLVCLPIADKLALRLEEEEVAREIVLDGVLRIRDSQSPLLIKEVLLSYLPERQRAALADAA